MSNQVGCPNLERCLQCLVTAEAMVGEGGWEHPGKTKFAGGDIIAAIVFCCVV